MIDLNTIAVEGAGLFGLEWTPRFGYDASATLINMYGGDFGEMMFRIATGGVPDQSWKGEFGAAVRLSIPPYPTEAICGRGTTPAGVSVKGIEEKDYLGTYMFDVELDKREGLVTAGHSGFVCVPLGFGRSIG